MSSFNFPRRIAKILTVIIILMTHQYTYALEPTIQLHKVDQSGAYGVSLGLTDNFFNQQAFNWSVSYNRMQDINVSWNDNDIAFSLDTVDFMLSYRHYPRSYNKFIKSLIFEFQAGAGVALTENKFTWPDLEFEKYYSEQGDVNPVVALLLHKKFSKQAAMHIGFKHYPSYSEFDDISSLFVGFSYSFGKQKGY